MGYLIDHRAQKRCDVRQILPSARTVIAAVPENGQANEALRRFLADEYDVTLNQVEIVAGHTSTRKTVRIRGQ